MAKAPGYLKLHRSILDWELYGDPAARSVFIHLMLTAQVTDGVVDGIKLKRGQCIQSIRYMSKVLGISERQVRTALDKLEATRSLTRTATRGATRNRTVVTICGFDKYQAVYVSSDTQNDTQSDTQSDTILKKNKEISIDNDNARTRADLSSLINTLRGNAAQMAALAKAHRRSEEDIGRLLDDFAVHLRARGDTPDSLSALARHFDNWLRKQRQSKPKPNSNDNSNRNYQKHGRRTAADNVAVCDELPPAKRLVPRSRVISGKTPQLGPDKGSH